MYPIQFLEYPKAVTSLKNEFSTECDGTSTSLFKLLAGVISQPLLYICMYYIKMYFFQACLEVANVLPFF